MYPHLREEKPVAGPTSTIGEPLEQLDLATVIKVSQALSGETVEGELIDTLMRTAIEYAGAERGLLILARDDDYRIEAEVTTSNDTVTVGQRKSSVKGADLPESVFHYAVRTKETVLLNEALGANQFSADEYIQRHRARSILCEPLLKQSKLVGVLYLENNLAPYVFTPARIAVLKLLASEAATSLENTRLYADLQEREAKVRRLVDTALDAVLIMDEQGCITDWNSRAESMFGWRREEAVGQLVSEMVIPMRYRSDHQRGLRHFLTSGAGSVLNRSIEIEAVRRNGSEFPVELSVAAFRVGGTWAFSGFVRDITERKWAQQMQSDFAHMNRVSVMGELAASLSHEITQPIASARNNARAAQNFLKMQPPDLGEVREALSSVVGDADRAGEIIDRIREQIKKAPPRKERFDLSAAIKEVIILARSVTNRNGVSVQPRLTAGLVPVLGDRVQLQQVLLNLILNAAEAMGSVNEGPRDLLICTEQDGADIHVAVCDSGPGIDLALLDRVFDAFYTTKSRGTGMGLSICRSIIHAHGGKLWAEANEPRGAVFRFTLPGTDGEPTNPLQVGHRTSELRKRIG